MVATRLGSIIYIPARGAAIENRRGGGDQFGFLLRRVGSPQRDHKPPGIGIDRVATHE